MLNIISNDTILIITLIIIIILIIILILIIIFIAGTKCTLNHVECLVQMALPLPMAVPWH